MTTTTMQTRPTATATLMISSTADAQLRKKPDYREEMEISQEGYARFPEVFTLTELPQPAIVAADCIENYADYLEAIPAEERSEYDLDVGGRWADIESVKRFINRALADAFDGPHFTVTSGLEHIYINGLYMSKPMYSLSIADSQGEVLDFYSSPEGFEQPFRIEARLNVNCNPAEAVA